MPRCNCPKCDDDISESYQEYDTSVGMDTAGWYCERCKISVIHEDDQYDNDEL